VPLQPWHQAQQRSHEAQQRGHEGQQRSREGQQRSREAQQRSREAQQRSHEAQQHSTHIVVVTQERARVKGGAKTPDQVPRRAHFAAGGRIEVRVAHWACEGDTRACMRPTRHVRETHEHAWDRRGM